jgi:hypothetical protein
MARRVTLSDDGMRRVWQLSWSAGSVKVLRKKACPTPVKGSGEPARDGGLDQWHWRCPSRCYTESEAESRTMDGNPLVSVLIVAYNAEHFIEPTILSVWRQSYRNIELLVLDNDSQDGTRRKLRDLSSRSPLPMRVIRSSCNLGPGGGLNALLDEAKGKYAAILDHDDFWHCDKTRQQVQFLESNPQYPACGSQIYVWWEKTGRVSVFKAREHDRLAYHLTLMFRLNREIRYDSQLSYQFDTHFIRNVLCTAGRKIYNFQQPMAAWRIRADGNNFSRRWNSVGQLWPYWKRTRNHSETMKGIIMSVLPRPALDSILRARHSIGEHRAGDELLRGFPQPIGPASESV